ncbi:MAG: pilus assembly protein MshD [Myxococcota bacterium]
MELGPRRRAAPTPEIGATLIELIVSILVISLSITGVLLLVNTTSRHSAEPMIERQAAAVAQAYLEEVLLKDFYDPDLGSGGGSCPTAESSRSLFDNVCDYNGLDDLGARDQNGAAVAGLEPYRVRVLVTGSATLGDLSGTTNVLRADVRVTHSDLVDLTVSGYRARY